MPALPDLRDLVDSVRDRFRALPIDRAPLRRAGLLSLALVALVIGLPLLMPVRPLPAPPSERQSLQTQTEAVSAPRRSSGGSAGRIVALLVLVAGGVGAFALRRRAVPDQAHESTLDILESVVLGPGHSLRLVACGDEVMLLSVGADGARMLRHWPRHSFNRTALDLPAALAESTAPALNEPLISPARADVEPERSVPLLDSGPEPLVEHLPLVVTPTASTAPPRGVLFPAPADRTDAPPQRPSQFLAVAEPEEVLVHDEPEAGSFAAVLHQFQVNDA